MQSKLKILQSDNRLQDDLSFSRMANFLGIESLFLDFHDFLTNFVASSEAANKDVLALSCHTLIDIQNDQKLYDNFKSLIETDTLFVFIYGVSSHPSIIKALYSLSEGLIKSVEPVPDNELEYNVSEGLRDVCQQFSGLRFGPISRGVDYSLELVDQAGGIDSFVTIDGRPSFLRFRKEECQIFITATSHLIDIQETTFTQICVDRFSELVPALMFLKYVFKDHCWHNNTAQGCFIIDDPLLKRKYGYLSYDALLEAMEVYNFHTSIAFVPWNFKRSNKYITDLFKDNANRFSICIHGCDHTWREFDSSDTDKLAFLVKQATNRMNAHKDKYGLDFDRVMIFPGEVFSSNSIDALKSNNYLAAVNSLSCQRPEPVSIESLLPPAFMEYEGFPIFQRRLPGKIADFALDLFLGKPVFVFEHHDFFKNGYGNFKEFILGINNLAEKIEWKSLGEIIVNSYLQKDDGGKITRIKIYANRVRIKNTSNKIRTYEITKTETDSGSIDSVMLNGEMVQYSVCDNIMKMVVDIKPGNIAYIVVIYQGQFSKMKNFSMFYRVRVLSRRYLSDFRDNYVSKNNILYSFVKKVKSKFS